MEITEYVRKVFTVNAVKVDFENYREVAEWCKGTLDKQKTRMMGTEADLPVIKIKGVGENRGKEFVAGIGCWVVELNGSYRVYKEPQFFASFEQTVNLEPDCPDCKREIGAAKNDETIKDSPELRESIKEADEQIRHYQEIVDHPNKDNGTVPVPDFREGIAG